VQSISELLTYLGIGDNTLAEWVSDLHQLLDRHGGVRYPTGHENMRIPRDIITRDTAEHAARLSSNIVGWCTEFINRN